MARRSPIRRSAVAIGRSLLERPVRRLLRNASWLFLSDAFALLAGMVGTIIAARWLGAADYGRVTLVVASVGAVKQLLDVRAWEAVTRYLGEFREAGERRLAIATLKLAALTEAAVGIAAFAVAWAAAGLIATRLLHDPALAGAIVLYAPTLVGTAFDGSARAVLRVYDRFGRVAASGVTDALTHLVLVAGALWAGASVRGVLLAHLAADLATSALLLALAWHEARTRLAPIRAPAPLGLLRPHLRAMAAFAGHGAFRATLKIASRRLDVLVLGHFRPPADVGHYRAALAVARGMVELSDSLYFAASPQFARAWVSARQDFLRLLRRMAGGLGALAAVAVVVGVAAAPWVMHVAFGASYAAALVPFRVLLLAAGIEVATLWGTPAALGSDQPAIATAASSLGVAVLVGLLLALVPPFGPTGAAWAMAGGALGYAAVVVVWLTRMLRPRWRPRRRPAAPRA